MKKLQTTVSDILWEVVPQVMKGNAASWIKCVKFDISWESFDSNCTIQNFLIYALLSLLLLYRAYRRII